jgi:hypothetical protein
MKKSIGYGSKVNFLIKDGECSGLRYYKMNKKEKAIQIRQRMWEEIDKIITKTEQEIVELMKEDAPSEIHKR